MLDIFAKIGLINFIVAVFLALQVLVKARKDIANWTFSLLAFSIAFWSFGYWQWLSTDNQSSALLWVRLFTVGSILIPMLFFLWCVSMLGIYKRYRLHIIGLALLSLLLIYHTFYTDLIIKGLQGKLIFPFWPQAGTLYIFYVLFLYIGLITFSLFIQYRVYIKSRDKNLKSQIKYIFWGSLLGFGGGITNFFLWYDIFLPPYFNFLPAVGLIMFYYAASKHSLFNIKVIATEFFIYVLWIALLARLVFAASIRDGIIDAITLILVFIIGVQLMKTVKKEVEQREELERLDKELKAVNVQLKVLDKARAEFISIASHQLRTPPATIKWYIAAILGGDFGPVSEQVKQGLLATQMTNNGLISLIDDLLNASRIERGKLEFMFEEADLVRLTSQAVEQLVPQAKQKHLELVFNPPEVGWPLINLDKEKVKQVINNLVDNAIKYTQTGSVTIDMIRNAKSVTVKVKDTGRGIPKKELKSVFEKYNKGSGHSTGLGLGLYVAKVVVEQHQGKIWVESEGEGKGSTFIIQLPIKSDLKKTSFDLKEEV